MEFSIFTHYSGLGRQTLLLVDLVYTQWKLPYKEQGPDFWSGKFRIQLRESNRKNEQKLIIWPVFHNQKSLSSKWYFLDMKMCDFANHVEERVY